MLVYLVRHGIAIDRADPQCPPDPERALTGKGTRRTRQAARGFAALHEAPGLLVSSPYVRAMETAKIFGEAFDIAAAKIKQSDSFLPDANGRAGLEYLRAAGNGVAMCVGHAPNLDEVVAALLGLRAAVTELKKAGVAVVEWHNKSGGGVLRCVYTPRVLRAAVSSVKND